MSRLKNIFANRRNSDVLLFAFRPVVNLLWVFLFMELTRLLFLWENRDAFRLTWQSFALISKGGLLFDTSAILYLNVLWLALICLPLHLKERPGFWRLERVVYVVCNSLGLLANLCDSVFFAYRQHRSTMALFSEFGGEGNIAAIVLPEAASHWYLVLLFCVMVWALWKLYLPVTGLAPARPLWRYYVSRSLGLVFWVAFFIFGVRGCTFSAVTRPISVGYAQRFASEPNHVDLVLNTPFSMLRTIGGLPSESPDFFPPEELGGIYSAVHIPADSLDAPLRGHNVVFLVLESFSAEFVGAMNRNVEGFKSYTPFLDSLMDRSVTFEHSFSNSGFSIDALPALLASTPRMRRPFVVSPYSLNHVTGIGELLGDRGYHTAFFHGADNESLGLQAFVRQAGFKNYYGLNEYLADPSTAGMNDFDGTWGIWDEQFLQFFACKISQMPQPFVAGVFTLSSHHPFDIPADRADEFPESEGKGILRLIRYSDDALRRFFATASRQPWFRNTVFVISADHTFLAKADNDRVNNTELGRMRIPIALFDPSGTLAPGQRPGYIQQIDVLPTLLGLLGNSEPYFAFGRDVFAENPDESWALRWNHVPVITMGRYMLLEDPESWTPSALYDFVADPQLTRNLVNTGIAPQDSMERKLKAIVQTYGNAQQANKVHL